MTGQLRRVRVVGTTGSGKTTFAGGSPRGSTCRTWSWTRCSGTPDWTKRDPDEARALIRAFVSSSDRGWVTDGNWTAGTRDFSTTPTRSSGSTTPAGR